jgi:hypothetical protein
MARKKLGEILIQAGVLDQSRLRAALVEQRRWGGHLGRILVDMKLISEDVLVQALSQQLNFPATNLDNRDIPDDVLDLIPGDMAEQQSLIPFNKEGKFLDVAMTDPTNLGFIDELRIRTQLNVRPYLAGPKMIERALAKHYGRGQASLGIGGGSGIDGGLPTIDPASQHQFAGVDVLELDDGSGARPAPKPTRPPTAPPAAPNRAADPMSSAQRRAQAVALASPAGAESPQIVNIQERLAQLEALVTRDEDVIRKLLGLLVEKGVATREEILHRIK